MKTYFYKTVRSKVSAKYPDKEDPRNIIIELYAEAQLKEDNELAEKLFRLIELLF